MKKPLAMIIVGLLCLSMFSMLAPKVKAQEPKITIVPLASLGPTDRWDVTVEYDDGSRESFLIEGTESSAASLSLKSEPLKTAVSEAGGEQIIQQDILLGFSYSWSYTLEIRGRRFNVFDFNIDLALPVQMDLKYSEPMVGGSSYPLFATLTPLDWPNFDEFSSRMEVLGQTIYDVSQSFITPIGPSNPWTPFKIGPFWFWSGIQFILFNLDVGLTIVPQLFSDRVEALVEVAGDAILQSPNLLKWTAPGQTLQFDILAQDVSTLDYATVLISQFRYFLNRLLIGFDLGLRFNWFWGGSSRIDCRLFTLDASGFLPSLSFGVNPGSPTSEIRAEVPVLTQQPAGVPEFDATIVTMTSVLLCGWLLTQSRAIKRRKETEK